MTVGGLASMTPVYHWSPGTTYDVYLEGTSNAIAYEQMVTAPSG